MVNFIKVKSLWECHNFWKKYVQLKGLLSNLGGRFVQVSVAFSENLNFIKDFTDFQNKTFEILIENMNFTCLYGIMVRITISKANTLLSPKVIRPQIFRKYILWINYCAKITTFSANFLGVSIQIGKVFFPQNFDHRYCNAG